MQTSPSCCCCCCCCCLVRFLPEACTSAAARDADAAAGSNTATSIPCCRSSESLAVTSAPLLLATAMQARSSRAAQESEAEEAARAGQGCCSADMVWPSLQRTQTMLPAWAAVPTHQSSSECCGWNDMTHSQEAMGNVMAGS
jgi:hypothetical protein